jgi:hypothetical protein
VRLGRLAHTLEQVIQPLVADRPVADHHYPVAFQSQPLLLI